MEISSIRLLPASQPKTSLHRSLPIFSRKADTVQFSGRQRQLAEAKLFIDNQLIESTGKETIPVLNPANQRVIGRIPSATQVDVDKAVTSARNAFKTWGKTTAHERAAVLNAIAGVIRKNAKELAALEVKNNGKPIVEAEMDIADSARHFEVYAAQITNQHGKILEVPERAFSYLTQTPKGVAGQIIPWNYPLMMAAWKLAPALAAGCTSVIKPAEQTPLSLLRLAELLKEANAVPPGVINVVTGGPETGKRLANHPDLDILSFTGSSEVGQKIAMAAANRKKPIPAILELGGKSPNIVFADADLDVAVQGALFGVMINQGQVCSAGSRILVQRPVYDAFIAKMTEKAKNITIGPGNQRETKIGPLVSKEQLERVKHYIELGKQEGARLVYGGGAPADKKLAKGNYLMPTIFADVNPNSRIAQEEIFGPVASIIPFDTEEEAITLANGTEFGLGAAVWTKDGDRQQRLIDNLDSGIVWVNATQFAYAEGAWGGVKRSGLGHDNIEAYQNTKWVHKSKDPFFDWYPAPEKK